MLLKNSIKLSTVCRLDCNRWLSQCVSLEEIADQIYSDSPKESRFTKQLQVNGQIYYYERGCQLVYPYFNISQAYCLGDWVGKYICEVYFKNRVKPPKKVMNGLIEKGFIRVNKEKVSPDYVMKPSDVLSHVFHFHENPIIDLPFKTVHLDDEFLVIDKPPGIPMHSAGFNRIDSVTSGLIVLVRNQAKASELSNQMANRKISKEYICEVRGNFPHDEIKVDVPLARCFGISGPVIVDKHSGLPSVTLFKKIKFDHKKGTSIISCSPLTGRTHQIRVHLQYLGFPIFNDFTYNSTAFGQNCGKNGDYGGLSDRQIYHLAYIEDAKRIAELREESVDCINEYDYLLQDYRNDEWVDYTHENCYKPELDSYCPECYTCCLAYKEPPIISKQFLHLHALRYKGADWEFATQLPYWAR
ncbi:pseudouridylate synthase RPUSD2-like isoform X2 [Panonychus citri]|uniref:pseudouridylate synthase RPUSD2-like isoform X2 n=1 Tax=Panonychus citri TaxID=50023 RepID=UPI0023071D83|nr:pseudouridylate synthase RPUSD2-like isoform X2 [Panonychus citri]